jgi:hypothetical protein
MFYDVMGVTGNISKLQEKKRKTRIVISKIHPKPETHLQRQKTKYTLSHQKAQAKNAIIIKTLAPMGVINT